MQLIVHQLKEKIKRISMKVKCCPIGLEVRDQDPLNLIWNGEDPFHGIDLIIHASKGVHDATSFKINSTKNGMIIGFKWYGTTFTNRFTKTKSSPENGRYPFQNQNGRILFY